MHMSLCQFAPAGRLLSGACLCTALWNSQSKAITKLLMSTLYLSASEKLRYDTFTHWMSTETRKHTPEAKSIFPLCGKIITAVTGLFISRYHPCSSLSGLTSEIGSVMHTFSEVRPACVHCHIESLRGRWWPAHHASLRALISVAQYPPGGRSVISTIWSAGQLGAVSWALSDEWIISSHLCLKHTVSKGWFLKDMKYRDVGGKTNTDTCCCHE